VERERETSDIEKNKNKSDVDAHIFDWHNTKSRVAARFLVNKPPGSKFLVEHRVRNAKTFPRSDEDCYFSSSTRVVKLFDCVV
jgi:hypothetical protein